MASDETTRLLRQAQYLRQYYAETGREYATARNVKCPNAAAHAHGDANASARIYENADGATVKCYGCGGAWDIFKLWQLDNGGTFAEAKKALCDLYGIARPSGTGGATIRQRNTGAQAAEVHALTGDGLPVETARPTGNAPQMTKPDAQTQAYIDRCAAAYQSGADEAGRAYMRRRGISDETARRFKIGFDAGRQAVIIPQGAGYMSRLIAPDVAQKDKCRYHPTGAPRVLFNGAEMVRAARDNTPVFIVEGEIDALSIAECGGVAVSIGGTGGTGKAVKAAQYLKRGVYVPCLDRDNAGEKAQARLVEKLREIGGAVYVYADAPLILLPDGADGTHAKDANEELQKDAAAFRARVADVIARARAYAEAEIVSFNKERSGILLRRLCDIPPTKDEKDDRDALIGNYALAKGEGWILAGEPGAGKSSFLIQLALFAGAGKTFFGFQFLRPLKVFYLQTELQERKIKISANSLRFAAQTLFDWSDDEFKTAISNVVYDTYMIGNVCDDVVSYLERVFTMFPFDLLVIDPLLTFAKDDLSLAKPTAQFLYGEMSAIMGGRKITTPDGKPVKFGTIIAHHTGKPRMDNGKKIERGQFATAGSYVINAWARFQLNLTHYAEDYYELYAAKNAECCTWQDSDGRYIEKIFIKRANRGERYWTQATAEEADAARTGTKPTHETEDEKKKREEAEYQQAIKEIRDWLRHVPTPVNAKAVFTWCDKNPSAAFKGFRVHTVKKQDGTNYQKRPCYLAYEVIRDYPLQNGVAYHVEKARNGRELHLYGGAFNGQADGANVETAQGRADRSDAPKYDFIPQGAQAAQAATDEEQSIEEIIAEQEAEEFWTDATGADGQE